MKPQSVDNFILFNIFGRKNTISKLMISEELRCKQGKGMLTVKVGAVIKYFCKKGMFPNEIPDEFIKHLSRSLLLTTQWRNGLQNLGEGGRAWRIMNGLGALKWLQ